MIHLKQRLFVCVWLFKFLVSILVTPVSLMHSPIVLSNPYHTNFLWILSQTPLPYFIIHRLKVFKCDDCCWSADERLSAESSVGQEREEQLPLAAVLLSSHYWKCTVHCWIWKKQQPLNRFTLPQNSSTQCCNINTWEAHYYAAQCATSISVSWQRLTPLSDKQLVT